MTASLSFELRPLILDDLDRVVALHELSFPGSRSTQLGRPFLRKMYQWYIYFQPHLSIVATQQGELVGFVTGARGGGTARRRFRYAFWQILLGFIHQPSLVLRPAMFEEWQSFMKGLLYKQSAPNPPQAGQVQVVKVTLDSIAVSPKVRGMGVGKLLVKAFEQAAQDEGATYIGIGVERDNQAARHLYENCGWRLRHENLANNSTNYVKDLSVNR